MKLQKSQLAKMISMTTFATMLGAAGSQVQAAGFALNDHSATASGTALAGAAASNQDISFSFWNPALLTNADGVSVYISGAYVMPEMDVKVNSAAKSSVLGGTDITASGAPEGDVVDNTLVPAIYVAFPIFKDTVAGFAFNAPFGLSGEYGKDWAGRYHSTETSVRDIAASFSLAHRVADWASVGGSVQIHQAEVLLASAITDSGTGAGDGYGELEGDDIGVSYSIGFQLEPIDGTRMGVGYRSEIDYRFEGNATYTDVDPAVASPYSIEDAYLYGDHTFPSVLTISVEQDIGDSLTVGATAMRTGWSALPEMRIKFGEGDTPGTQSDSVLTFDFEDQWFYSIGATYDLSESFTLRAGYAKDNSPIKDEYRSPRTPDGDRTWISLGGTYHMTQNTSFTFAYTNVSIEEVTVNRDGSLTEDTARGTLNADYESSADVFSLAMNMDF